MSAIPLRPLGFGEILDRAFTLYRHHFLVLFITALVYSIPLSLVSGMMASAAAAEDPEAMGFGWLGVFLVIGPVVVVGWAALTRATAQAVTGGEVSVGDSYRRGLRAFLPLLGAIVVGYIALVVVMMVLGAVVAFGGGRLIGALGGGFDTGAGGVLFATMFGLVFALVAIMAFAALFAVAQAVVVERLGPLAALRRSWQLSRGARLRVVGVVLVSWLIVMLPWMGVMLAAGLGTSIFDPAAAASMSTTQIVFQQGVGFLSGTLTFPFLVACLTVLYYDRRVRTEAYDLEVATEGLASV
ncbi:hypothetical protein BH23GEM3_BH23GEM3_20350 [soil metagenome]|nr:hypothetical protein [Gemmatimonadota bacterium]